MNRSVHRLYCLAIGAGVLLWIGTALVSGRSEAWDSPLYWSITYPLCLLLAGAFAYFEPERPWRWALALMLVQPLAMLLTSGSSLSLLPLGLVMFAILALPPILIARVVAWLRLRRRGFPV
jgi:peptidoglycan/LPS O-acetylase OafA/YrhL